jgi:hypothetical protein
MKFFPLIVRRLLGQFARAIKRSNIVSTAGRVTVAGYLPQADTHVRFRLD